MFVSITIGNRTLNVNTLTNMTPRIHMTKSGIIASGKEGKVCSDEVVGVDKGQNNESGASRTSPTDHSMKDEVRALHSQIAALKETVERLERKIDAGQTTNRQYYQSIQASLKIMSNAPGRPISFRPSTSPMKIAQLSDNPKTLYDVWEDYCVGVDGRKPAREFTPQERGKVKHKFTRRKVVWDTILRLIHAGLTAEAAIEKIYDAYGREKAVTAIINSMKKHRRDNFVPLELRIGREM